VVGKHSGDVSDLGAGVSSGAEFILHGTPSAGLRVFAEALRGAFESRGYRFRQQSGDPRLVLNFITPERPRHYRRRSHAVFVLSLLELPAAPPEVVKACYPYLVRSLANLLLVYVPGQGAHFLTLELGHYVEPEGRRFAERVLQRIDPMASSKLVIENRFNRDLAEELWDGDELTRSLGLAGERLAEWDLLPAPFPLEEFLTKEELRHVKRLFGIGGLSYGNLSARRIGSQFWMSASGVDKSRLRQVGRDILLVTGYDSRANAMELSVPPGVEPRRVSVDAIEHWMIYRRHPEVRAVVHVHAWMEGIRATDFNYPCGTFELGQAVAEQVSRAPEPARTVVGLKNHGITITGVSFEDIFERVEGRLLANVPMM
jgi:ribulose-5-phosphate 4-epimerase/fuculose-1-phosphate aldolase